MRPTLLMPRVSASCSPLTSHARFDVSTRPSTTGPAMPKHACVRVSGRCAATNSRSIASSESYLPLGKLCAVTTRTKLLSSVSNSATFVFVHPMSPAIIIFSGLSPRLVWKVVTSPDGGREHTGRYRDRTLINPVVAQYVKLAAQPLALGAGLVAEHAPDRVAVAAVPHARLKLALVPTQRHVELVARGSRNGERRYHPVAPCNVVGRDEFGLDLSTVARAQVETCAARVRRRAFAIGLPAETGSYPAEREQRLRGELFVRDVGRVVLDANLLDAFERGSVVCNVPEARDERAPGG